MNDLRMEFGEVPKIVHGFGSNSANSISQKNEGTEWVMGGGMGREFKISKHFVWMLSKRKYFLSKMPNHFFLRIFKTKHF